MVLHVWNEHFYNFQDLHANENPMRLSFLTYLLQFAIHMQRTNDDFAPDKLA